MEHNERNAGFTIVELLVALSVFSIAMSIIGGLFIQTIHTQKILGAVIEASSNTGLMFEQMSRELRLGYNFTTSSVPCSAALPDFATGVAFRRFRGTTTTVVVYEWNRTSSTLERTEEMGNTVPVTSPDVAANRACFRVDQGGSPKNPWRITIIGNISPRNLEVEGRAANLETTVSSRVLPSDISETSLCPVGWLARFANWSSCPQ